MLGNFVYKNGSHLRCNPRQQDDLKPYQDTWSNVFIITYLNMFKILPASSRVTIVIMCVHGIAPPSLSC